MRVHHALRPEGSGAASSLLCGCQGVRGQQRPSLGGCRREAGGRPALCSQGTDRVEGKHPLFGENQNSSRGLPAGSLCPRLLTLAGRLDGDLLAAVAPAGGGDGGHP